MAYSYQQSTCFNYTYCWQLTVINFFPGFASLPDLAWLSNNYLSIACFVWRLSACSLPSPSLFNYPFRRCSLRLLRIISFKVNCLRLFYNCFPRTLAIPKGMGVHGLWTILNPIQKHVPLRSLGGQKLAIDLSGWVCGDICVNQRAQTGCRLYLRYANENPSLSVAFFITYLAHFFCPEISYFAWLRSFAKPFSLLQS